MEKLDKSIMEDHDLVDLKLLDPDFVVDLRYATEDNFTGKKVYPDNSKAILRKGTALKLIEAHKIFKKDGYRIKIWDAYRPLHVQYIFWEYVPNPSFVADPKKGSKHNMGTAVDITLLDKDGNEIEMGTVFDDFTEKASLNYPHHNEKARENMEYMKKVMVECGFTGINSEWWHFDDVNWKEYEVLDISFDEL